MINQAAFGRLLFCFSIAIENHKEEDFLTTNARWQYETSAKNDH